jgi:hypothetical protein
VRVAVQDEACEGVVNGVVGDMAGWQSAVVWGEARRGAGRRSVRGAGHVEAERGIVRLEEVVVGRLMGERRHGRVAMPRRRRYARCGVRVLVLVVVVKVDLHGSARWGGSARQHAMDAAQRIATVRSSTGTSNGWPLSLLSKLPFATPRCDAIVGSSLRYGGSVAIRGLPRDQRKESNR